MNFGILVPIVAIIASAWVAVALIKFWSREGSEGKAPAGAVDVAENRLLASQNERLQRNVERLEERLAVLETIATDPAQRTAREIEQLR